MVMSYLWAALICISLIFGAINGTMDAVSSAALEGAAEAVKLSISLAGILCLWSGILEVMKLSGTDKLIAKLARPVLGRLFPETAKNDAVFGALTANVSANLLGLGNAATPLGIGAAKLMTSGEMASNELCAFVVMNTASLQIIPATIAGIRANLGASAAFDILPCVWISSVISLSAGLIAERLLRGRRA